MQETVLPAASAPYATFLYVLIPLLPFLGFLLNGLLNKRLSGTLAGAIGSLAVLGSFLISGYLFLNFQYQYTVKLFDWISVGSMQIPFSYQIDQLSLIMLLLVTGVGFLIHVYSIGYMHHDENVGKFFSFLNLFVFSMLVLVLGSNFVILFIGWEGVGLCSYLLIGFWNKNTSYNNAAKKAFIINRVGDLGFLLGIFLIYLTFDSVQYAEVFQKASTLQIGTFTVTAITLLLFVGAMGKSAQLPLYTWLPDAMAGPTPVSALIHAATMVTAGIYMILRANVLFTLAPHTLEVIAIIGAATALFAATIGLAQNDIKKVLAYSTVSQLGYMFLALGVMGYSTSLFHVLTHAFFKALMFLGAGSVIHAMSNEQDMRRMGGLRKALPITFITFLIGCLAIAGIPPFSGFFSKDEILLHAYEHSKVLYAVGLFTAFLTAFYMFRLLFLTFFGEFRGTEEQKHHLHESPASMTLPLVVLAILAAVGGFMNAPFFLGEDKAYLANYLAPLFTYSQRLNPAAFSVHADHATELMLIGLSVGAGVLGIILAYVQYVSRGVRPVEEGESRGFLETLIYHKYYIDELYNALFVRPTMWLSKGLHRYVENGVIDPIVNGFGRVTMGGGRLLRYVQTGSVETYLILMVVGIVLILALNSGKL
ncbi:NADH-quinone oxidoreductase subunit L [Hymenobacter sp. BT186]|uniref:NADH-quinone oxidoreductase subunit L n=1 Tax=Hymenobacter telluris TaxID=2816474 RepID=A0A939EW87_9BACT|nr:NADH-quinone oxidoreductase subunit L [Hymenobacter telluris]MBO0357712.1 NADH-quinone oxidoreductase subunit L [Hymenobacter telluris]MBW3373739.1 NADH-quinone oxidoreductase subunit L [Hymenobacter norwichensis]